MKARENINDFTVFRLTNKKFNTVKIVGGSLTQTLYYASVTWKIIKASNMDKQIQKYKS